MKKILTFGILLLFLLMTVSSANETYLENKSINPMSFGNILYVGGNGTGNYSSIQDAVNDAIDGDTVFVYDNSSPYYENLIVNKSINLIGENKNTTVVDGSGSGDVVSVSADFVNINWFTIQNSGNDGHDSGVEIHSNYCNISDNFLENNRVGIFLLNSNNIIISNSNFYNNDYVALYIEQSNNNIITNNVIFSCGLIPSPTDIYLDSSSNNIISKNKISIYLDDDEPSGASVNIFGGSNNTISGNYLCSGCSLWLTNTSHTIASGNTMVFSVFGVVHWINHNISIIHNNFFKNHSEVLDRYVCCLDFDLSDDLWDGNYWNRPRLLPKPIFGIKIIELRKNRMFPWINFDWHPAKEPYDIEV